MEMKNARIDEIKVLIDGFDIHEIILSYKKNNNLDLLLENKDKIQSISNSLINNKANIEIKIKRSDTDSTNLDDNSKELINSITNINNENINKDNFLEIDFEIMELIKKEYVGFILKICKDFYTFDEEGRTLIDDVDYDRLMELYINLGGEHITISSYPSTNWPIEKHNVPFMVGSIKKTYDEEELNKFVNSFPKIPGKPYIFRVMPKYDGISVVIEVTDGKIISALTRKDGINGQNITPVLKYSKFCTNKHNKDKLKSCMDQGGYIKCELCISTEDFKKLTEFKKYRNRRSATSGITNSPKNIQFSEFITIIPLYYVSRDIKKFEFLAPEWCDCTKGYINLEELNEGIMHHIRKPEFPYRVDGVVIYPYQIYEGEIINNINTKDLLEDALAFKINTKYALTTVEGIYPSIGRFGKVTPMAKVKPCEVNETTVTDISLSNVNKLNKFCLHENEEIEVYSAGDVIPMLHKPRGIYDKDAEILKLQDWCPYCHEKLNYIGNELYCTNPNCKRLITGKIINFLDKLGARDISDRTIEILYENNIISSIKDIFKLDPNNQEINDKLVNIEGFNKISSMNLCNEIENLKRKPIEFSMMLGALGIRGISYKKCKLINSQISLDSIYKFSDDINIYSMAEIIAENIHGIKTKTLIPYIDFVIKNKDLIEYMKNTLNIIDDKKYKGNIVFTGFRDNSYEPILNDKGYELSENINKDTKYLIVGDWSRKGKLNKAHKKNIPVLDRSEFDDLIENLN